MSLNTLEAGVFQIRPSLHRVFQYQWLKGHSSFDKTLAEAPEWLLKLMEREEVLLTPFEGRSIVAGIKEGSRNSTLTSLAGTMRARGMTEEGIYTALLAENNARSFKELVACKELIYTIYAQSRLIFAKELCTVIKYLRIA